MGLEPTTTGITIQYSNQLSYGHRVLGTRILAPHFSPVNARKGSQSKLANYLLKGRI